MLEQRTKDFIEQQMKVASRLFEKRGQLLPVWAVETGGGEVVRIGTPFTNTVEKEIVDASMRQALVYLQAVRYCFVYEAWVLRSPTPEQNAQIERGGVKSVEGRIEVVRVTGGDRSGNTGALVRTIFRDAGGKGRLGEPEWEMENGASGRFENMLTPPKERQS
jgi:hypothetical protein